MTIRAQEHSVPALTRLVQTTGREPDRAVADLGAHLVADVDSVVHAVEHGGLFGGAPQGLDILSPGHRLAHGADAVTGRGALDPRAKEALSAAANAMALHPAALKDLFDLARAITSSPASPRARTAHATSSLVSTKAASAHSTSSPTASSSPSRGYGEVPRAARCHDELRARLTLDVADLVALQERFRGVVADDRVRTACPRVAAAGDRVDAVAVAVVVDVLTLCPHGIDDVELAPYVGDARSASGRTTTVPPAPDLAAAFAPLLAPLGLGLSALGGLLANPIVSGLLAPLLVQGLNLVVPGLGLALAPVLPFALPLVGQLLGGVGAHVGGGPDLAGVVDAMAAFAGTPSAPSAGG